MPPEFSRPFDVARTAARGRDLDAEADATERAALARRLGVPAINSLRGTATVVAEARDLFSVQGRLEAEVVQTCVVDMSEFPLRYAEDFVVLFARTPAPGRERGRKDEGARAFDLDPEDDRALAEPFEGETLDLGEILAQQLSLALDPFPRRPDVALPEGVGADEFAAEDRPLAKLGELLSGERKR